MINKKHLNQSGLEEIIYLKSVFNIGLPEKLK